MQEILTESAQKIGTAWEETEDKPAVGARWLARVRDTADSRTPVTLLGFGFIGLWATAGILKAIDNLILVPDLFELIGIFFSAWFIYRWLLFKPDREELKKLIAELKTKILQ